MNVTATECCTKASDSSSEGSFHIRLFMGQPWKILEKTHSWVQTVEAAERSSFRDKSSDSCFRIISAARLNMSAKPQNIKHQEPRAPIALLRWVAAQRVCWGLSSKLGCHPGYLQASGKCKRDTASRIQHVHDLTCLTFSYSHSLDWYSRITSRVSKST